VALSILIAMVALAGSGLLSMLEAALLAAGAMLMTGCLHAAEARKAVDWQVLVVIAASFGLGNAMHNSGAATLLASKVVGMAAADPWLTLAAVYLTTTVLTELISNNAAAVLVFPIAAAAARDLGVDFTPFAVTLMMAASASFSTPIGYQCNLMVYGPGGYRFGDYVRMGVPLNLLSGIVTVTLVPTIWPF
jgi:di/tricarboxylate transporter